MKSFYTLLILCAFANSTLNAQMCTPLQNVPDDIPGVYPLGTIEDTVCINNPFLYDFTVVVTDSFSVAGFEVALDSIRLATSGAIMNLPAGLDYTCNPPNCSIAADSKGCLRIEGTVTDQNEIGDHELIITAEVFVTGFPISTTLELPTDDLPPFILTVREESFDNCFVLSADQVLKDLVSMTNAPNPFNDFTRIELSSLISGAFEFDVFDILGNKVHHESLRLLEGNNTVVFERNNLSPGMYVYSFSNHLGSVAGKMTICD